MRTKIEVEVEIHVEIKIVEQKILKNDRNNNLIQIEDFPFYRYCMLPLLSLPHSLPRSPPLPSQRLDPPCYVVAMEQNKIN